MSRRPAPVSLTTLSCRVQISKNTRSVCEASRRRCCSCGEKIRCATRKGAGRIFSASIPTGTSATAQIQSVSEWLTEQNSPVPGSSGCPFSPDPVVTRRIGTPSICAAPYRSSTFAASDVCAPCLSACDAYRAACAASAARQSDRAACAVILSVCTTKMRRFIAPPALTNRSVSATLCAVRKNRYRIMEVLKWY